MAKDSAARASNQLAEEQFQWNKEQARKAEIDAARQRAEEQLRQGRITDAVARLNTMFDGGVYRPNRVASPVDGQTYYDGTGKSIVYHAPKHAQVPNRLFDMQRFFGLPAEQTQQGELIDKGTGNMPLFLTPGGDQGQTYKGFDDSFFKQRANTYFDYYKPQVEQQFGEARTQMKYGLGSAGTLQSSFANTDAAKLARDRLLRESEIKSKGESIAGDLRTRVNQVRSNLLQQIQTANDPNDVMQTASAQMNSLRADPIQYDPIGQIFASGAKAYGAYQNGQMYGGVMGNGGGVAGGKSSTGTGKNVG